MTTTGLSVTEQAGNGNAPARETLITYHIASVTDRTFLSAATVTQTQAVAIEQNGGIIPSMAGAAKLDAPDSWREAHIPTAALVDVTLYYAEHGYPTTGPAHNIVTAAALLNETYKSLLKGNFGDRSKIVEAAGLLLYALAQLPPVAPNTQPADATA
jgi:hypothetical protein